MKEMGQDAVLFKTPNVHVCTQQAVRFITIIGFICGVIQEQHCLVCFPSCFPSGVNSPTFMNADITCIEAKQLKE